MSEVGAVIPREGVGPLRIVGVLNGQWLVTPVNEYGPVEMLSAEEAQALNLRAPETPESARARVASEERERNAEVVRAYAADHPAALAVVPS